MGDISVSSALPFPMPRRRSFVIPVLLPNSLFVSTNMGKWPFTSMRCKLSLTIIAVLPSRSRVLIKLSSLVKVHDLLCTRRCVYGTLQKLHLFYIYVIPCYKYIIENHEILSVTRTTLNRLRYECTRTERIAAYAVRSDLSQWTRTFNTKIAKRPYFANAWDLNPFDSRRWTACNCRSLYLETPLSWWALKWGKSPCFVQTEVVYSEPLASNAINGGDRSFQMNAAAENSLFLKSKKSNSDKRETLQACQLWSEKRAPTWQEKIVLSVTASEHCREPAREGCRPTTGLSHNCHRPVRAVKEQCCGRLWATFTKLFDFRMPLKRLRGLIDKCTKLLRQPQKKW